MNSPTYKFDKSLTLLLNKFLPKTASSIKNSHAIKKIIDKTSVTPDYNLISLDAVSLFSKLPKDLILDAISTKW